MSHDCISWVSVRITLGSLCVQLGVTLCSVEDQLGSVGYQLGISWVQLGFSWGSVGNQLGSVGDQLGISWYQLRAQLDSVTYINSEFRQVSVDSQPAHH